MMATPKTDKCTDLVDVIGLNRYYGWYVQTGDLKTAEEKTRKELLEWQDKYPDKPIMYTEYGADTVAGSIVHMENRSMKNIKRTTIA